MSDELLQPLNWMIDIADELLTQTTLDDLQRKFVNSIASEAREMRTLILTFAGLSSEQVEQLLSYEGRSHLTTIIGYAEVLLDEDEGELSSDQREVIDEIRAAGRHLLDELANYLQ